jgi:hypothetical protein
MMKQILVIGGVAAVTAYIFRNKIAEGLVTLQEKAQEHVVKRFLEDNGPTSPVPDDVAGYPVGGRHE